MKPLIFVLLCLPALLTAKLSIKETGTHIEIKNDGKVVLTYHKALMPPPEGQPDYFARSGFIHPIASPSGGVVTGIHPDDHIHHMGLWHAWVETYHDGRNLDFWNLKEQTATIRYVGTQDIIEGDQQVGFTVRQHHVALAKAGRPEQVILEEDFSILVRATNELYQIDHKTVQTNVSEQALELPAYRYGGPLAYRAPYHWDKSNSNYLTSEGKDRNNGHQTRARWCAMYGPTEYGYSTIVILGHPDNHDAPQRQRIWPESNHEGRIFFNWVPIQEHAWSLQPGQPSKMQYRLLVHDGRPNAMRIERAWTDYAGSP